MQVKARALRAAGVLVALVPAAGCGGSPAGHATQSDPARQGRAVAFARCMRSHGVPGWPDPSSSGVFDKSKLTTQRLGAAPSTVGAAQNACRRLLPNGGVGPSPAQVQRAKAQGLRYAACVRGHGVPGFPDPGSDGRIPDPGTVGIDQGSPRFEAANRACGRYRPPYIPSNSAYNSWARSRGGS